MESTFGLGAVLGFFVIGTLAGVIVTRLLMRSEDEAGSLKTKVEELTQDHKAYQDSVNEHFARTANLIETLNRNYAEIQTHLMQGAEKLVDPDFRLESLKGTEQGEPQQEPETNADEATAQNTAEEKEPEQTASST